MAGIKHNLQQFGQPITNNFSDIKDPIDRHMAYMTQQVVPYCRVCGKQLLQTDKDEMNRDMDWKREQATQMCTKCYNIELEKARQAQAQAANQKPKEIDWEELKKKYARE